MLKISNPRLGKSNSNPVASEIAYNSSQTGLPANVQDAITQLDTNINIISNDYETKEVFTDISGETSGTVETYANISIMQEEWANEDNAIAVEIVEGKPSEKFLFTDEGEIVRAIIDAYGNYTLNGIPTATNYAICYLLRGSKSAFGTANIPEENIINEYDYDSPFVVNGTDIQPINLNYNLDLKNGGLKDSNAITAIKLSDSSNTTLNTTNKTILGGINELLGNKADKDGANAVFDSLSIIAKENIVSLGMPDYTAGVNIKSALTTAPYTWTAPCDGIIKAFTAGNATWNINYGTSTTIDQTGQSNNLLFINGEQYIFLTSYIPISKGETIATSERNGNTIFFYPYKGVIQNV